MITTRPSLSLITFLALTATLVNGASTNPTGALLAKLLELQAAGDLKPRQTSSSGGLSVGEFPAQCQQGCTPAINAFNSCTSATCLCNTSVDASLNYCINCSVDAVRDSSVINSAQQVLDTYNKLCAGSGVATLTLSNASGGGSATTSLPGGVAGPSTTITNLGTTSGGPITITVTSGPGTKTSTTKGIGISTPNPLIPNAARPTSRAGSIGYTLAAGLIVAFFIALAS